MLLAKSSFQCFKRQLVSSSKMQGMSLKPLSYNQPKFQPQFKTFATSEQNKVGEEQKTEAERHLERVSKNPFFKRGKHERASKREILNFLKPIILEGEMKTVFRRSMILLVASKSLSLCSPFFLKMTVNALAMAQNIDLTTACIGIGAFGLSKVLSSAFGELRMNMITQIIQSGSQKVAMMSFTHLHSLDLYFHRVSAKNTVFAIHRALKSIESGLRFSLGFFSPVIAEFVLLCGMLYFYCGPMYLGNMLVTLSMYTIFSKEYSKYRQNLIRKRKNSEKQSEFYLNESIMNYETVKAFNNENLENVRYNGILEKIKNNAMKVQRSLAKLNIGQQVIFSAGLTVNLLLAAWDVSTGRLTPGDFVMIQAFFMQLSGPLFNMGTLFREIDQSQVEIEDLFYMLKQRPQIVEKPDAKDYEYKGGDIEFRNVSYKHPKEVVIQDKEHEAREDYLFKNLNLKIKAGSTNAIVGPSGFGKTTMIYLMFRIYDPVSGQLLIDGQDLKDLKFHSYRKYISVVPQNGILFNDTILFNLQYGNPNATIDEIIDVTKKCQIHHKIMEMPDQYESHVGDLGSKLSGGERQRLLIARGLLKKDAKIFYFDEATSNLDAYTEKEITFQFDKSLKGKTVIYCAHRLSSIMNVDTIHVLKDGRVVEEGSHQKLISDENSVYSDMWRNYLRESEEAQEEVEVLTTPSEKV